MFNFNNILTLKQSCVGIEINSTSYESIIHFVKVQKSKNEVYVIESYQLYSFEELFAKLDSKLPIGIVINNDQVLFKELSDSEASIESKISNEFPTINLNEFYYEVLQQDHKKWVALCRKSYIDKIINELNSKKIPIGYISIGIGISSVVFAQLTKVDSLQLNDKILELQNNKITKIESLESYNQKDSFIKELEVYNSKLLAFCSAVQIYSSHYLPISNFSEFNNKFKKLILISNWFNRASIAFLYLILTTLIINFGLYLHFENALKNTQEKVSYNIGANQKYITLRNEVLQLQHKAEELENNKHSKSSWYMNQIASIIPNSITLLSLDYQPLKGKINPKKNIEINENNIVISGNSTKRENFSNWLSAIENIEWVDKLEIAKYQDKSNQLSEFTITLTIKDVIYL